jgi:hypothetical protein
MTIDKKNCAIPAEETMEIKRISATSISLCSIFMVAILSLLSLLLGSTSVYVVEARLTMHRIQLEKTTKDGLNRELLLVDDHYREYRGNFLHDQGIYHPKSKAQVKSYFYPSKGSFSYPIKQPKKKSEKTKTTKSSRSMYQW